MESKEIVGKLVAMLLDFERLLEQDDIRTKVLGLLPSVQMLQMLGKSLIPEGLKISARDRILAYFVKYPKTVIKGDEILLVAGISEWARRVRELRVEFGWPIISGLTVMEMDDVEVLDLNLAGLKPDDYILIDARQDLEAAYRWNLANEIRKAKLGMREKILRYLQQNVGKSVSGEELRYLARGTEWARRVRELRTEEGWPIATKTTGRPDLPVGSYVLEKNEQSRQHDRLIPDPIRRSVMMRDKYACRKCGWSHNLWNPSDPRHLEIHHVQHHAKGGESTLENLITYCTICHDEIHRIERIQD